MIKVDFKKNINFWELASFAKSKNLDNYLILSQAYDQNVLIENNMKFLKSFINCFKTKKNIKSHEIMQYPYTIEKQKKYILNLINSKSKIAFSDLIDENPLKILVIYNFLAILDLVQNSKVLISIGDGLNNFWLSFNS